MSVIILHIRSVKVNQKFILKKRMANAQNTLFNHTFLLGRNYNFKFLFIFKNKIKVTGGIEY